jgi:hypothetical protein
MKTKNTRNFGIKTHCEACGKMVLGVIEALQKVDGRYLCLACAAKAKDPNFATCPACGDFISSQALSCPKCGAPQSHNAAA